MKKSLLEIVKSMLNDTDSDDVNSISETVEALQFAHIVESVFNDIISTRSVPEHESLIKLTALSDSDFPTHFVLEDNQAKIEAIWYDTSTDSTFDYKRIHYETPMEFLQRVDRRSSDSTVDVKDKTGGTNLRIYNDRSPTYYTSFDDEHIVMDAFNTSVDSTLQQSKVRAIGVTYPTFTISDDYVPDLDVSFFPYLIQESKSRAFAVYKGSINPKVEQTARRQKVHVQNDKHRTQAPLRKRNYGRS